MCAKLSQVLTRLVPEGPLKEAFTSSYYRVYYNRKHFRENGFRVNYKKGHFTYGFDDGVSFASYENMADELKRSLRGYLAKYSLKKGDIVVDCGAYIGEFALYAARAVGPAGAVIAFEPDPTIFGKLKANVMLNGLENVVMVNKGAWSADGVLQFVGDNVRGYSFMFADKGHGAIDIPVASLDNELGRLGVKKVDFIKIDVEGAELELIKGAEKTLRGNDVKAAIASYHVVDGKKACAEVERMFRSLGYAAATAHPQHLTTYAWKDSARCGRLDVSMR